MGTMVFNSVSPWYFFACLLAGLVYAVFLYLRTPEFTLSVRMLLAALRGTVVTLIFLLLLDPLLKKYDLVFEKPVIVIAQDHSASIATAFSPAAAAAYKESMLQLVKSLGAAYRVKTYSFGAALHSGLDFHYADRATDFSALFGELAASYENQNLGAVIIASDGIYNRGADPLYLLKNTQAPFYTIALGDTTRARDLAVQDIDFNNLVYEGDKFQLQVTVTAHQLKGQTSRLTIQAEGKTLYSTIILINSTEFLRQIPVMLDAGKPGYRKITVSLSPVSGEVVLKNNQRTVIVEVIRGKLKILLLSAVPHPDLTALRQALQAFRNDEVTLKIGSDPAKIDMHGYDLAILNQLPFSGQGTAGGWSRIMESQVPLWFIIGDQTDAGRLNTLQNDLSVLPGADLNTELLAEMAPAFSGFTLSDSVRMAISGFPPLLGPAAWQVKGASAVIMRSQSKSGLPLLFSAEHNARKVAYLLGSGIWRWRLADFDQHGNHHFTDALFGKLVQYLTAKGDKRRFRISMPRHVLNEDEPVNFDAFLFNESYEPVNTEDIILEIKNNAHRTYKFGFTKTGTGYNLTAGALPPGDYSYHATVVVGNHKFDDSGEFIVRAQQLEELTATANHNLLYQLAVKTGGKIISPAAISTLPGLLAENELVKTQSQEIRSVREWISIRWLAVLLLFLLATEWGVRKWNGFY